MMIDAYKGFLIKMEKEKWNIIYHLKWIIFNLKNLLGSLVINESNNGYLTSSSKDV